MSDTATGIVRTETYLERLADGFRAMKDDEHLTITDRTEWGYTPKEWDHDEE